MTDASPRVRLGLFLAALAVAFGAAFGVGSLGDPVAHPPMPTGGHDGHHG